MPRSAQVRKMAAVEAVQFYTDMQTKMPTSDIPRRNLDNLERE